jgi:hypothetical protein
MTDREAMKLALEALDSSNSQPLPWWVSEQNKESITSLRQAIKELESQEPVAQPEQEPVCPDCKAKVLYECVACSSNNYPPPQRTEQEPVAHLWECLGRWSAYLVDNGVQADCAPPPWLVDAVKNATTPPQPTEQNFCSRCGKRTKDIHTCTPPKD